MGGYGSGRYGGRPTVEDSLTLNLPRLLKDRLLKVGAWTFGALRWTVVSTGKEIASMGFRAHVGEDNGYIQLNWTSKDRWSGETRQCENRITLTTMPQPFGGCRWFFICPRTGERATKLHLPSGAHTFACRKAYRLGYRCQRETPRDRSVPSLRTTPKNWRRRRNWRLHPEAHGYARADFRTRHAKNLSGRGDSRRALRSPARSAKTLAL